MSGWTLEDLPASLTPAGFRDFQATRPDHERWELIEGAPVRMPPAFLVHNVIMGNLDRLLTNALAFHDPTRLVVQRVGVELGLDIETLRRLGRLDWDRPEPDLIVVDADAVREQFARRIYLFAEVTTPEDQGLKVGSGTLWTAVKADLYRAHPSCGTVLVIAQERIEVEVSLKRDGRWSREVLTDFDAELALPEQGFRCSVGDLYRNTPLRPRPARHP